MPNEKKSIERAYASLWKENKQNGFTCFSKNSVIKTKTGVVLDTNLKISSQNVTAHLLSSTSHRKQENKSRESSGSLLYVWGNQGVAGLACTGGNQSPCWHLERKQVRQKERQDRRKHRLAWGSRHHQSPATAHRDGVSLRNVGSHRTTAGVWERSSSFVPWSGDSIGGGRRSVGK